MTVQSRETEADTPHLQVSFLGREYSGKSGAKAFTVTSTLTNIYDGWTLDLPIINDTKFGEFSINADIMSLNLHRWLPIIIKHSDPNVGNGKPVPLVMGVCTHAEQLTSDGASVLRLTGYDLGKLLDSCVRPWVRFRGLNLQGIIDRLIDPSWRAKGPGQWGIQGARGLNGDPTTKLGQRLNQGIARTRLEFNKPQGVILPPVQTEVGETFYDLVSRYARLTGITNSSGAFVNVSSDGWIQVFNPDESANDSPLYVFEDHASEQNTRVKRSALILDGEDLYTSYRCYGSVIFPPQALPQDRIVDYNAGRFFGQAPGSVLGDAQNRINRLCTFADPEQYQTGFAGTRAQWREKQSRYKEKTVRLTVQGHSIPGPDGQWRPIVEGNICELNSTRLRLGGDFLGPGRWLIEQVVKRQDAITGSETDVVLRLPGLLGA